MSDFEYQSKYKINKGSKSLEEFKNYLKNIILEPNVLSNEEYSIISDNSNSEIKFKFKLIEFFTNNGLLTAKN